MFQLPNICYGCSACAVICPKQCIEMKMSQEGVFFPFFVRENCIDCNLCNDVCISRNGNADLIGKNGIYYGWSLNSIVRNHSTSGGVVSEIMKYASENGMYSCGVVYDKEKMLAKHIVVEPFGNTDVFAGSKYLMSYNTDAFREIIKMPKAAVVSTPCQIAGLDQVLRKKNRRKDFLLVELICKSVPTYNLYNKYMDHIISEYNMTSKPDVVFRYSKKSWKKKYIYIFDSVGHEYIKSENEDAFYKLFLNGYGCSEACYECRFCLNSSADIRIGDFWGPRFRDAEDTGYNMIVANSAYGVEFLNNVNIKLKRVHMSEYMSQKILNAGKPDKYEEIKADINSSDVTITECSNKAIAGRVTFKHKIALLLPKPIVMFIQKFRWKRFCKNRRLDNYE